MTREQFTERMILALQRFQGRRLTPELKREFEDAVIDELADIRDDITAGAVRLR